MARKSEAKVAPVRIVVLQRGWVFVGRYHQDGEDCRLEQAKCIRRWGTTQGLGELATKGPVAGKTTLDPAPTVRFHALTVVATIDCPEAVWAPVLAA